MSRTGKSIAGALALLFVLGLMFIPSAEAVTRLDKVNGAGTGVNLTTSGNFTIDAYTDVAGANINFSMNTSSGTFRVFCSNSTLGGNSGAFNTTCSFATTSIIEGNLTLKALANYSTAGGQANSSTFEVHVDYTAPVTNSSSITLEGGTRTRPNANRTFSIIATDVNYSVANCTFYINPDSPSGVLATQDSANKNNFSYSFVPNWAGWGEVWANCQDSHTRNTGDTTKVAFQVAGSGSQGATIQYTPTLSAGVPASGTSILSGSVTVGSKTIPKWLVAVVLVLVVYFGFFDKKKGGKKK